MSGTLTSTLKVERKVRECAFCQANSYTRTYEPLKLTPMPDGPWQSVAGDFLGPMADGTYYMVNTCLSSRWFDVKTITSTNADTSHLEGYSQRSARRTFT